MFRISRPDDRDAAEHGHGGGEGGRFDEVTARHIERVGLFRLRLRQIVHANDREFGVSRREVKAGAGES